MGSDPAAPMKTNKGKLLPVDVVKALERDDTGAHPLGLALGRHSHKLAAQLVIELAGALYDGRMAMSAIPLPMMASSRLPSPFPSPSPPPPLFCAPAAARYLGSRLSRSGC